MDCHLFLIPLAPPWSIVALAPSHQLCFDISTPLASPGSSFPPVSPSSSVTATLPRSAKPMSPPQSCLSAAPPWPSRPVMSPCVFCSAWVFTSTGRFPGSAGPLHHGFSLHRLHHGPSSCLRSGFSHNHLLTGTYHHRLLSGRLLIAVSHLLFVLLQSLLLPSSVWTHVCSARCVFRWKWNY